MKFRRTLILLLAVLAAGLCPLLLTSCAQEAAGDFVLPDTFAAADGGTVAENDRFALTWDDAAMCILLQEKATGRIWSTTPYDYYQTGKTSYTLSAPLTIEYYDREDGSRNTLSAVDCMDMGTVSAEKTDDGLRVVWYFDEAQIAVPVVYALREDSLLIEIEAAGIREGTGKALLDVSVAPYLCSAKNGGSGDYLFVPAGGGALMATDTEPGDAPRTYSGEIYGEDPTVRRFDMAEREEPIRLPMFGVKSGDAALCAIVEQGDGAAAVEASAGSPRNGYSAVYVTFHVRGYNRAQLETSETVVLSAARQSAARFAVGYYPLSGDEAGYTGMAACYRRYLQQAGALKKSEQTQAPYQLTFVGGAETDTFTLGVPHTTLLPLTTFADAAQILSGLPDGSAPSVVLRGFGSSGADVGRPASGLTFPRALGGSDGQQELERLCRERGILLATDFDLVRFSRSGSGVHTLTDGALSANRQTAVLYPHRRNVFTEDTDETGIRLLTRTKLLDVTARLANFCDGRVSGISLSTFGSIAYADYRDERYALRGDLSVQAAEVIAQLQDAGHTVALSAANGYAAGLCDSLYDVPLQNGSYTAFDRYVPVYAMVYHGAVPMYSAAVDLADDPQQVLLRAAEAGVAPAFEVIRTYAGELATTYADVSGGTVWANVSDDIARTAAQMSALVDRVAGSEIVSHEIDGDVTRTGFANGVTVTVDHAAAVVRAEGGSGSVLSFTVEKR